MRRQDRDSEIRRWNEKARRGIRTAEKALMQDPVRG